jgi:small ligand-binding sensory domain FIST
LLPLRVESEMAALDFSRDKVFSSDRYLGPIPIAGFFTGFEIGALGENTSLLQYSGVLALISNKKS